MRDLVVGGGGLVAGGLIGALGVVALEVVVGGVVAATLWLSAPVPPSDVAGGPQAMVSPARTGAPRGAPVAAPEGPKRAAPGEVQVLTAAAVQVALDGAPVSFDPNQGFVAAVAPGEHRLQVFDLLGRITADTTVQVVSGRRAQLRYAKGTLTDLGEMPMPDAGAAARPAPIAAPPVGAALVGAGLVGGPPVPPPVPPVVVAPGVVAPLPPAGVLIEPQLIQAPVSATAEPTLTIGNGVQTVEIKLPKLGLGRN